MTHHQLPELTQGERFSNMFGCVEMEVAALKIYKSIQAGEELNFYDFTSEDEQKGLFMLAVHGWLNDCETSGWFEVGDGFFERILSKLFIKAHERSASAGK